MYELSEKERDRVENLIGIFRDPDGDLLRKMLTIIDQQAEARAASNPDTPMAARLLQWIEGEGLEESWAHEGERALAVLLREAASLIDQQTKALEAYKKETNV